MINNLVKYIQRFHIAAKSCSESGAVSGYLSILGKQKIDQWNRLEWIYEIQ